jgi:hypothetical protein
LKEQKLLLLGQKDNTSLDLLKLWLLPNIGLMNKIGSFVRKDEI